MLSLETLGIESLKMEKRDYLCRVPMSTLLREETKTSYSTLSAETQLLSDLKAIREQSSTVNEKEEQRRPISHR
jgi:hypothetical protein